MSHFSPLKMPTHYLLITYNLSYLFKWACYSLFLKDDYDDCVIVENPEEASAKMPPPSELPINIHNRRNVNYLEIVNGI